MGKYYRIVEDNMQGFVTTSVVLAEETMRGATISFDAAIAHLGVDLVHPNLNRIQGFRHVPYSLGTLRRCSKEGDCILVVRPPVSIFQLREKHERLFRPRHTSDKSERPAASFMLQPGYAERRLVRKTPAKGSLGVSWAERGDVLEEGEYVPSATLVVYLCIMHYLTTGERLFPKTLVTCSDPLLQGYHVQVGLFTDKGLLICFADDQAHSKDAGIAVAASPNTSQKDEGVEQAVVINFSSAAARRH